jgi:hypothetical protein
MLRVDAGLAADRGIYLRQERGRDLDEIHAPADDAGGEARQVADHTAAESDYRISALQPRAEDATDHGLEMLEALGLFARRQGDRDRRDPGPAEACGKRVEP